MGYSLGKFRLLAPGPLVIKQLHHNQKKTPLVLKAAMHHIWLPSARGVCGRSRRLQTILAFQLKHWAVATSTDCVSKLPGFAGLKANKPTAVLEMMRKYSETGLFMRQIHDYRLSGAV